MPLTYKASVSGLVFCPAKPPNDSVHIGVTSILMHVISTGDDMVERPGKFDY